MNTCFRVLVLATSVALSGCSTSSPSSAAAAAAPARTDRVQAHYDAGGKLQKLEYDRNSDGTLDMWGYMDGSHVVRVESDENGDGKVDKWEFHRPVGATGAGARSGGGDRTLERVERATRFDGRVSRWEHFEDGLLTRVEEDTDANGKVDKWETYADGALSMMALDTKGRGTPDRRLLYQADGSFDRLESDPTGSGTFQRLDP